MTADSIHYKILLQNATLSEMVNVCPSSMRDDLNYAITQCDKSEIYKILDTCMDIPAAVKDEDGRRVIMSLIDKDTKLAAISDEVRKSWEESPERLLEFIRYPIKTPEKREEGHDVRLDVDVECGLRNYQIEVARRATKELTSCGSRLMLHAPTGSGKTRTAMSIISMHFREHGPTTVLWLASGAELMEQAKSAFEAAWKHHGDTKASLRLWYGNNKHFVPEQEPARNCMLVAGLQKVSMACTDNENLMVKLRDMVSLIVFDEAHQTVAPTYRQLVEGVMSGGTCRLLGITATPGRATDQSSKELAEIYSKNRISVRSPRDKQNVISYLEQEGYLAEPHFHHIMIDGQDRFLRDKKIVEVVSNAIKGDRKHKRIIVFCPTVSSAHMCAAMLRAMHGIENSYALDAGISSDRRENIISKYSMSTEEPFVIFNWGILTQGFDAPLTSAVVIARSTESVGLYSQMIGRGLRGIVSGGNKCADIYTIVEKDYSEFSVIVKAFENWNHLWEEPEYV